MLALSSKLQFFVNGLAGFETSVLEQVDSQVRPVKTSSVTFNFFTVIEVVLLRDRSQLFLWKLPHYSALTSGSQDT